MKVSWHRSDGSGEARAPCPLTRQRGGVKNNFMGGKIVYGFLIQRPFLVGASGYFGVLKQIFPSVKSF